MSPPSQSGKTRSVETRRRLSEANSRRGPASRHYKKPSEGVRPPASLAARVVTARPDWFDSENIDDLLVRGNGAQGGHRLPRDGRAPS